MRGPKLIKYNLYNQLQGCNSIASSMICTVWSKSWTCTFGSCQWTRSKNLMKPFCSSNSFSFAPQKGITRALGRVSTWTCVKILNSNFLRVGLKTIGYGLVYSGLYQLWFIDQWPYTSTSINDWSVNNDIDRQSISTNMLPCIDQRPRRLSYLATILVPPARTPRRSILSSRSISLIITCPGRFSVLIQFNRAPYIEAPCEQHWSPSMKLHPNNPSHSFDSIQNRKKNNQDITNRPTSNRQIEPDEMIRDKWTSPICYVRNIQPAGECLYIHVVGNHRQLDCQRSVSRTRFHHEWDSIN